MTTAKSVTMVTLNGEFASVSRVRDVNGCPHGNEAELRIPRQIDVRVPAHGWRRRRPLRIDVPVDEALPAVGERLVAVLGPIDDLAGDVL
jgi:hypothetical protein